MADASAPPRLPEKLRQIVRGCDIAARRYGSSAPGVLLHLARLYLRQRIGPRDALRMGLADPATSPEALSGCVSKARLVSLQRRVNPDDLFWLTGDKAMFNSRCLQVGLPVARTLAVFDPTTGPAAGGNVVSSRTAWEEFFSTQLPREFIIKPARSGFGEQVHFFERTADRFQNSEGTYSAANLYDLLASDVRHKQFVIQERLESHPELVRLSGTPFLQTVRMTTFVDDKGRAEVLYVNFKIITGTNVIDNFRHGKTGNLVSNIAIDTGVLGAAMTIAPDGVGVVRVDAHPATNVQIAGFQLPFWGEAVALARSAAELFLPLRTLGWDVALTPTGPVIVEANHLWDPLPMLLVGPQAPGVTRHGMHVMLDRLHGSA